MLIDFISQFTATDAIPFLSVALPVHHLRIHAAVELCGIPTINNASQAYEFEADVTGYYNDPTPLSLRNDRLHKSGMTHTKTQWIYADKNPRVDRVLGSNSLHAGSRLFIEGDYTFPCEKTVQPGYIEARNASFNGTNRSTVGSTVGTGGVGTSGGSSSRRRNAQLKQSPTRGSETTFSRPGPSSSQARSSVAGPSTPQNSHKLQSSASMVDEFHQSHSSPTTIDDDEIGLGFVLGGFSADDDVAESISEERSTFSINTPATTVSPIDLRKKRGNDEHVVAEGSKRQRKQSAKAREAGD